MYFTIFGGFFSPVNLFSTTRLSRGFRFTKNHRRGRYTTLLTEGKLNAQLHEIDLDANEMLDTIIGRLAAERGIDEDLKARDMLRWVAEMNNIKANAEEIVLREVVLV